MDYVIRGSGSERRLKGRISILLILTGLAAVLNLAGGPGLLDTYTAAAPVEAAQAVGVDLYGGQFDPDVEVGSVTYDALAGRLGAVPTPKRKWKIGAVLKFLGNPYWQAVAEGIERQARELGLRIDVSAGAGELDEAGQLAVMEAMVAQGYDAILISPQRDRSLLPAIEKARKKGILLVNIADAVPDDAEYYVGPNHYEAGAQAAQYFIKMSPQGGKIALIKGPSGVYSVRKSTWGFIEALPGALFDIVAQAHCDWDLQTAFQTAVSILKEHPDLRGFYCNSDVMALGVAQAVKMAGKSREVLVIGTDGIDPASDAVNSGDMTGTVRSFPYETGRAAIEVAIRILGRQRVPRVVHTPQESISRSTASLSLAVHPGACCIFTIMCT